MFNGWRLGSLLGFPLRVRAGFLLLLAMVALGHRGLGGAAWLLVLFASVVVHELGHAVVARRLGVGVAGIELGFFGGTAQLERMPRAPSHELAIAAAGPAVSLALAALGVGLGAGLGSAPVAYAGLLNLGLALFNLVPALPMDGGRILRALLARRLGHLRATELAVRVARVVAVAFFAVGLAAGEWRLALLAVALWAMTSQERWLARLGNAGQAGRAASPRAVVDGVEVLDADAWAARGARRADPAAGVAAPGWPVWPAGRAGRAGRGRRASGGGPLGGTVRHRRLVILVTDAD